MNDIIYMDYHATTPIDPRVLKTMMPYLTDKFGNSSSLDHAYGHDASQAVEFARKQIADSINANPNEIIFTSGATESNNLALVGIMTHYAERGNHIITCMTEHAAILDVTKHLTKSGIDITYLDVNQDGIINLDDLEKSITDQTVLISIMVANNEIGTIADIEKIGKISRAHNIIFHTDASQAIGHIPIDVKKSHIDLMSFSSHKICGPKGIGALFVRNMKPRINISPIIYGGGQERNIRSGTLNVPNIVGFGKAMEISQKEFKNENIKFEKWFNYFYSEFKKIGGVINGPITNRLYNNVNVRFDGIDGKAIINSVSKNIAISAGSACTTQSVEPSHVLLAIGLNEDQAHSSIRIGLGRFNTDEDVKVACSIICNAVKNLQMIT